MTYHPTTTTNNNNQETTTMKLYATHTDHLPTFDEKLAALQAVHAKRADVTFHYRPIGRANRVTETLSGTVYVHRDEIVVTVGTVDMMISDVTLVEPYFVGHFFTTVPANGADVITGDVTTATLHNGHKVNHIRSVKILSHKSLTDALAVLDSLGWPHSSVEYYDIFDETGMPHDPDYDFRLYQENACVSCGRQLRVDDTPSYMGGWDHTVSCPNRCVITQADQEADIDAAERATAHPIESACVVYGDHSHGPDNSVDHL